MKFIFSIVIALSTLSSCAQTKTGEAKIFKGTTKKSVKEAVATFGEGCFWHTEIVFQSLDGVRDAVSGYAGGTDTNPEYEEVTSGKTGHAETVNVYYDPSKISYQTLVKAFFESHDPTQVNKQGNDVGTQYRSIVFYRNEEEKKIVDAEIKKIADSKKYKTKIATEVKPFTKFYAAEDYHQEYISINPDNPYVKNVSIRDYVDFRKNFKEGKFKS